MRKRWIQHPQTHELIPAEEYIAPQAEVHLVMPDIQPYTSMIDGSVITSRSKHRAHLRANNCIEVGNETNYLKPYGTYKPPAGLKEQLIRVFNEKVKR